MMKRSKRFAALILTGVMAATTLFGCGSSSGGAASDSSAADSSSKNVLKVGMECAYAPFNWTQDTDTTPDGSKAVKIAGSDYYAYGYDVAVAQKLADQMGMDLEVHKVEWSSIGISLDAGDYDCIIAGMGKTKEREVFKCKGAFRSRRYRLQSNDTAWNRLDSAFRPDKGC